MNVRECFERDGIVFPLPVLSAFEVARYAGKLEPYIASGDVRDLHLRFDWARELATHPRIVANARAAAGCDIAVWGTLLLSKAPGTDEYVPWHQDGAYRTFEPEDSISAWVALTDSTADAGCMRAIAGSHREALPHRQTDDPHSVLRNNKYIETVDESAATDVVLHRGEMSLHHLLLVHGSQPNRAAHPRTGFIIRFLRAGATSWDGPILRVGSGR